MCFSCDKNNLIVMSSDQNNMLFLVKYSKRSTLPLHVHTNSLCSLLPALIKAVLYLCPDLIQKVCLVYRTGSLQAPHGRCLLADPC